MKQTLPMEKSLAFEMVGGRLKVKLEECVPTVRMHGETYYATETPSVTVNGRKHFVEGIA